MLLSVSQNIKKNPFLDFFVIFKAFFVYRIINSSFKYNK